MKVKLCDHARGALSRVGATEQEVLDSFLNSTGLFIQKKGEKLVNNIGRSYWLMFSHKANNVFIAIVHEESRIIFTFITLEMFKNDYGWSVHPKPLSEVIRKNLSPGAALAWIDNSVFKNTIRDGFSGHEKLYAVPISDRFSRPMVMPYSLTMAPKENIGGSQKFRTWLKAAFGNMSFNSIKIFSSCNKEGFILNIA